MRCNLLARKSFCFCAPRIEKRVFQEPFTISGTGKQVRDVLHADDMKTLYLATIEHIDKAQGQAFNIGGGINNSLSLLELFDILETKPWKVTLIDTGNKSMTGGRLKRIKDYVKDDETFCFTYGDGVGDINITKLIEFHKQQKVQQFSL